jgi:hypothetical protein
MHRNRNDLPIPIASAGWLGTIANTTYNHLLCVHTYMYVCIIIIINIFNVRCKCKRLDSLTRSLSIQCPVTSDCDCDCDYDWLKTENSMYTIYFLGLG